MVSALKGNLTAHHKFMLQTIKESITAKQNLIAKLDSQIEAHLKKHELELDSGLSQAIPRVGKDGVAYLLAEIGSNMEQFPDEKHLASWAGMSLGSNESAGKKSSRKPMAINI